MRKLFAGLTTIALFCAVAAQAVTIQENTVFPAMDIIASQEIGASSIGIRDIPNPIHAICGQTFTITNSTTLRAITLKANSSKTFSSGDDMVELWIGADTDTNVANFVAGGTNLLTSFDLNGVTLAAGNYYTINLDSDLALPAGDYGFQLKWENTGAAHQMFFARANGDGDYDGGGLVYGQKTDGSFVDFPLSKSVSLGLDLVFGLHTATIGTVPAFSVVPEEIAMLLIPPNNQATGTVEVAYTSDTTVDISVSISDESHPGSFSVLSTTPQTLPDPSPSNTVLAFEFDNTVSNLVAGESATGLVTIAWNETGKTTTNLVVLPISASTGFAPDANNVFNQTAAGTWGSAANWSLGRVPGALGADRGIIQNPGYVCNVETNYTGVFPYKVWVRTATGATSVLNVGADLKGSAEVHVGQATGQYGILNHTNGTVGTAVVKVGVDGVVASNSVYNLTGGTLELDAMTASRTVMAVSTNGTLVVDGGAVSMDLASVFGTAIISGGGTVSLQSGSIDMPNGIPQSVVNMSTPFAVSGGSMNLSGQDRFYSEFKVIGDAATIHFARMGTYGTACRFVFELGANGVSTIDSTGGYQSLANATLLVDGSNYTGGSTTINLFQSSNLNNMIAPENIFVTNFAAGVSAVVAQDQGTDLVTLTISAGVYDDWAAEYGVGASTNNPDGDALNNLYEFGLGGDPTNSAVLGMDSYMVNGSGYIDYVHVRRVAATNEISYALALTDNLVIGSWTTNTGYTVVGYGPVVGDFDTVTNRIDTTGKTAEFIDLVIEELP